LPLSVLGLNEGGTGQTDRRTNKVTAATLDVFPLSGRLSDAEHLLSSRRKAAALRNGPVNLFVRR